MIKKTRICSHCLRHNDLYKNGIYCPPEVCISCKTPFDWGTERLVCDCVVEDG